MQFPFYSLRTGIVACLTFLILAAMLLINVVMVKFAETDLIDAKVEMGRILIHTIGQRVGYETISRDKALNELGSVPRVSKEIAQLLKMGGYSSVLVVSSTGARVFGLGSWGKREEGALVSLKEALTRQKSSLEFLGESWGVTWLAPEMVRMSAPFFFEGRLMGAVAICAHLSPLYQGLRKSERIILVYICLNAVILVLFGIYLLSRTVVKPIHRLLTITDKFEEWPPLFDQGESSRNEIGQLFRSLKMMLKRLETNKKELKANISSLEEANLEIKKAQNEIIKSEKMASAGRLATGVAHEIGNPLSIILGYLELLKRGGLKSEEYRDFVERIESEVARINRIIRELLDFSRPSSAKHEKTGIHQLIMETGKMIEPQPMMDQIEIRQELRAEKDVVWAEMAQLKQVFLNIIMNAADSMIGEGVPSDDLSPKVLGIVTENEDDSIVISFTDTGIGISSEELGRIFDPFYTTKEPGKGTGLGLSVCYTIIEELGGRIRAESVLGKGSKIVVKIPLGGRKNGKKIKGKPTMFKQPVLVIDDEENMRHMLKTLLGKANYSVQCAGDGIEALQHMAESDFDYILCDIKMPRMDGMRFLEEAVNRYPEKTYIMMSAYGTVETALEAIKKGAYDYISKPFKPDEVLLTLKKAEERERLKKENVRLKTRINEIEKQYSFGKIIARSEAMAHVLELVKKVAEHKTTVLITGESGTGKELIARAIHSNGPRSSEPLVNINCGGIPENLIESELFGYKKGAFTDAVKDKPGRFEEADKGTIFLDEIGELPFSLQVKLLRVLQEEEITPLGGVGSRKVDVRVVVATSKDLSKEVEEGRFREDLYYRINVLTVHLPPLRKRKGDVSLLAGYFIDIFNEKLKKRVEAPSSETMSILMSYHWPGNVRELENVMERAVLLSAGRLITPKELPSRLTRNSGFPQDFDRLETLSIKKASKRLQRNLIEKALKATNGNRTQSAKLLEISRPMLISKIKEYGLS